MSQLGEACYRLLECHYRQVGCAMWSTCDSFGQCCSFCNRLAGRLSWAKLIGMTLDRFLQFTKLQRPPMQISTRTIWIALHRCLIQAQVAAGGSIPMRALQQAWETTHLRRSDLAHALDSLVRASAIRLEMSSAGPQVRMVSEDFVSSLNPDDYQREIDRLDQLAWVRENQKNKAESVPKDRRATDIPEVRAWKKAVAR